MFNKIKRNLMKYFGKSESETKTLIDNRVNGTEREPLKGLNIDTVIMDNYHVGVDLARNEDKTGHITRTIKKKVNDPKEKLKIKLQIIAKRTKSGRIREKNLKRLVNLFGNY